MSLVQRIIAALEAGLWKFVRIVHSSNRDYPYHDYVDLYNPDDDNARLMPYAVGTSNVNLHGDQSKRFVSKRMLIWTTVDSIPVHFNDPRNVAIVLPIRTPDGTTAAITYGMEFHANINAVFVLIPIRTHVYIYCEGVLPEEARDAE
jgi:hypothetical protein